MTDATDCIKNFRQKWENEAGPLAVAVCQECTSDPCLIDWVKDMVDETKKFLFDGGRVPCNIIGLCRITLTNRHYYEEFHQHSSKTEIEKLKKLGISLTSLSEFCKEIHGKNPATPGKNF